MTSDVVTFGAGLQTIAELEAWYAGARDEFVDPSEPVCQLFFQWQADLPAYRGELLACGASAIDGELVLACGSNIGTVSLRVQPNEPEVSPDGMLLTFGAIRITAGVWALTPSLNVSGALHGYVVLHGVPDPAPWERLVVLR